jgi:hypothetical protein
VIPRNLPHVQLRCAIAAGCARPAVGAVLCRASLNWSTPAVTSEPAENLPIPAAGYTFGRPRLAQALRNFESLEARRNLAMGLHIHARPGAESGGA